MFPAQSKFKCDNFLPKDGVMRCMLSHLKLTTVAEGFKVSAVSSVVTGKEIEAEIQSLQNDLEGNAFRFTLKALVYII